MSIATKKTTIINNDSKHYVSFNAYTRKPRSTNGFKKPRQVKVVNLDPTDDPSKVCEAYRQIKIDAQNKRIAKNEARLAEKRRLAEQREAREAEREAEREKRRAMGIIRSTESKKMSPRSVNARKRNNTITETFLAGGAIDCYAISYSRSHVDRIVADLRNRGKDIVSITSATGKKAGNLSVSLWRVDNFERPSKRLNEQYTSNQDQVKEILKAGFLQGFVLGITDVRASETAIRRSVASLREDGWPICVVKNGVTDKTARGWLLPCKANGLNGAVIK